MKKLTRSLTAAALIMVVGAVWIANAQDKKSKNQQDQYDFIQVESRLMRGDQLAQLLGFDKRVGDPRSVYAVGFVLNNGKGTAASVRIRLETESDSYSGWSEAGVVVVPGEGRAGKPFMERLAAPLRDEDLDLSKQNVVAHVLEVHYK